MPTDPRPTLANDGDTSLAHRIARRRPAAHRSECVECGERLGDGLLRSWSNLRE
jgi:L-rhamnose isomerase